MATLTFSLDQVQVQSMPREWSQAMLAWHGLKTPTARGTLYRDSATSIDQFDDHHLADLNLDGHLDIVTTSHPPSWCGCKVLRAKRLQNRNRYLTIEGDLPPHSFEIADFDGDGDVDVLANLWADLTDEEQQTIDPSGEVSNKSILSWYENNGEQGSVSFADPQVVLTSIPAVTTSALGRKSRWRRRHR